MAGGCRRQFVPWTGVNWSGILSNWRANRLTMFRYAWHFGNFTDGLEMRAIETQCPCIIASTSIPIHVIEYIIQFIEIQNGIV